MVARVVEIRGTLVGQKEIERNLRNLTEKVARKVIRKGLNAAAGVVQKRIKRGAPRRHGSLRRSIVKKVLTSKDKNTLTAVIGVDLLRTEFVVDNGRPLKQVPANYMHLVNWGHVIRRKKDGPIVGFVHGTKFVEKWVTVINTTLRKFRTKLWQELIREIRKKRIQKSVGD